MRRIGDLVPHDGVEIVKTDAPADDGYVGVEGENKVASEVPPRSKCCPTGTYSSLVIV